MSLLLTCLSRESLKIDNGSSSFIRPLLVIGGSSDVDQESMGAFQEFPQVQNDINFLSVTVVGRMTNIIYRGQIFWSINSWIKLYACMQEVQEHRRSSKVA